MSIYYSDNETINIFYWVGKYLVIVMYLPFLLSAPCSGCIRIKWIVRERWKI